jgi:hypothetical protein
MGVFWCWRALTVNLFEDRDGHSSDIRAAVTTRLSETAEFS